MKFKRTVPGDDVSPVGAVLFDFMLMMEISYLLRIFYAKITKDTFFKVYLYPS